MPVGQFSPKLIVRDQMASEVRSNPFIAILASGVKHSATFRPCSAPLVLLQSLGSNVILMYQPEHFRVEDLSRMHALMRARPFAALVSTGTAGLYATHLPTILKDEGLFGLVECHWPAPTHNGKTFQAGTRRS